MGSSETRGITDSRLDVVMSEDLLLVPNISAALIRCAVGFCGSGS